MRRTKEEAAQTREDILDAALACFNKHGLSKTTLDQIASDAHVTRGAVYWHFTGKQQILHAIRDRFSLPLLDKADTNLLHGGAPAPLDQVERFLLEMFGDMENDPRKRDALILMNFKCEFVNEMKEELAGMSTNLRTLTRAFEAAYEQAQKAGQLADGISPKLAGLETAIFMAGLVRLWLLDCSSDTADYRKNTQALIKAHIQTRRR